MKLHMQLRKSSSSPDGEEFKKVRGELNFFRAPNACSQGALELYAQDSTLAEERKSTVVGKGLYRARNLHLNVAKQIKH